MRKSNVFLLFLFACWALSGVVLVHARSVRRARGPVLAANAALVKTLGLTDLALFTEARYTRHLSQADAASAFQDHPLSLDHFPSGSLLGPPQRLRQARWGTTAEEAGREVTRAGRSEPR